MRKRDSINKIILVAIGLFFTIALNAMPVYNSELTCNVKCGENKTFSVADIMGASYNWTLTDEKGLDVFNLANNSTRNTLTHSMPTQEGFYKLRILADKEGCKNELILNVMASNVDMKVNIESVDYLCNGQERVLTAKVVSAEVNENQLSYEWFHNGLSMNLNTPTITIREDGRYEVQVSAQGTAMKHSAFKTFDTARELPELVVEDDIMKFATTIDLTIGNLADPNNDKGYKYEWSVLQEDTNKELILNDEKGSSVYVNKINKPGIYTVKASDDYCTSTAKISVERWYNIGIPTGFSPKGGNALKLVGNPKGIKDLSIVIYNRDGLKIFETTDINVAFTKGWDGRRNGVLQPIDGYVYFLAITFDDGEVLKRKGSISLLR